MKCECGHDSSRHRRDWIHNLQKGTKRRAFICRAYVLSDADPHDVDPCDCFGFKEKILNAKS